MCGTTRLFFYLSCSTLILSGLTTRSEGTGRKVVALSPASNDFETVHTSNAAILNRLGMAPLQIPNGHHKKRLSGPQPFGFSSQTRIHQPYSRRHNHHDSHVYVIKLPSSSQYYTITKPHRSLVKDTKIPNSDIVNANNNKTITTTSFKTNTSNGNNNKNSPVEFHSNGKPAKIYHWNLPLVKKISEKLKEQAQLKFDQQKKRFEETFDKEKDTMKVVNDNLGRPSIEQTNSDNDLSSGPEETIKQHIRNNDKRLSYPMEKVENNNEDDRRKKEKRTKMKKTKTKNNKKEEVTRKRNDDGLLSVVTRKSGNGNKTYRLGDASSTLHRLRLTTNELPDRIETAPATSKLKKHRKKAAMSYYAPISAKTMSINKNFPGNGKPKAFYVMEKSRKPVYYHQLLP